MSALVLWLIYKIMFKYEDTARYYEKGEVNHALCSIHITLDQTGIHIKSLDRDSIINWQKIGDIRMEKDFIVFTTDYNSHAYIPRRAVKGATEKWAELQEYILSKKSAASMEQKS